MLVSPVFDTYWRFAAERQALFMRRVSGQPRPWTNAEILAQYRFTNAYRASDRVSQHLIRNVICQGKQSNEEVFFARARALRLLVTALRCVYKRSVAGLRGQGHLRLEPRHVVPVGRSAVRGRRHDGNGTAAHRNRCVLAYERAATDPLLNSVTRIWRNHARISIHLAPPGRRPGLAPEPFPAT